MSESPSEQNAAPKWLRFRVAIVALFAIGPPVLAIPWVGDSLDQLIYSEPAEPTGASVVQVEDPAADRGEISADQATGEKPTSDQPAADQPAAEQPADSERSQAIQRELQQLGANYTLLEQYSDSGDVFRFVCRVDDETAGKTFEAQRQSPIEAMEAVLDDVKQWIANRQDSLEGNR